MLGVAQISANGDASGGGGGDLEAPSVMAAGMNWGGMEGGGVGRMTPLTADVYDSLALPSTRRARSADAPAQRYAHFSGLLYIVVFSVLLFHYLPPLGVRIA